MLETNNTDDSETDSYDGRNRPPRAERVRARIDEHLWAVQRADDELDVGYHIRSAFQYLDVIDEFDLDPVEVVDV